MWPFSKTRRTPPVAAPDCTIITVVRHQGYVIVHCSCSKRHHVFSLTKDSSSA